MTEAAQDIYNYIVSLVNHDGITRGSCEYKIIGNIITF